MTPRQPSPRRRRPPQPPPPPRGQRKGPTVTYQLQEQTAATWTAAVQRYPPKSFRIPRAQIPFLTRQKKKKKTRRAAAT